MAAAAAAAKQAVKGATQNASKPASLVPRSGKPGSIYHECVKRRDRGVGLRFRRSLWNRELDKDTYVDTVHVETWITINGLPRGKAYGVYTFRGIREDVVRPIRGANKREWHVTKVHDNNVEWAKSLCDELKWTPPVSRRHYSIT